MGRTEPSFGGITITFVMQEIPVSNFRYCRFRCTQLARFEVAAVVLKTQVFCGVNSVSLGEWLRTF